MGIRKFGACEVCKSRKTQQLEFIGLLNRWGCEDCVIMITEEREFQKAVMTIEERAKADLAGKTLGLFMVGCIFGFMTAIAVMAMVSSF